LPSYLFTYPACQIFVHPPPHTVPRLRDAPHQPGAQLLFANLAHVLEADLIPLGKCAQAHTAPSVRLQNPATQIIRICSSHAFCVAEYIATSSLRYFDPLGYIYLGTALANCVEVEKPVLSHIWWTTIDTLPSGQKAAQERFLETIKLIGAA